MARERRHPGAVDALPCGDITPTVGIVGTPVIDPAPGVIYAVADTWNGSQAQHVLEGFRLSDGARVLSTAVDPPGADPKAILQRTALNLDGSNVVFGYGGNDGDCSNYKGAVVSVPESGAAPSFWQVPIAAPSTSRRSRLGDRRPCGRRRGDIYASTGNPEPAVRPGSDDLRLLRLRRGAQPRARRSPAASSRRPGRRTATATATSPRARPSCCPAACSSRPARTARAT